MKGKITREQIDEAKRQKEIWSNREKRLANWEKYIRSEKDRKRTHRLIQYGAAFEGCNKELAVLTDEEIFELMEKIVSLQEVKELIREATAEHAIAEQKYADQKSAGKEENRNGTLPFLSDADQEE